MSDRTRETTILARVLESPSRPMSPELAQHMLEMHFPAEDRARYDTLADKTQEGDLTPAEDAELDEYLNTDAFLMILQSKARMSLKAS